MKATHSNYFASTRRIAAIAFTLAILFNATGCVESDVPKNDYFPLRDGNHWEYRLLDRPLLGRLNAGQTIVAGPLNKEVAKNSDLAAAQILTDADTSLDVEPAAEAVDPSVLGLAKKETATARRVALDMQAAVDELTFKATYDNAEQVWSKRDGYVGFQSPRGRSYLLILPPHSNYRWVVTGAAGQNQYFEIETARAEVIVPAGKFSNCALSRSESRDKKEIFKYWFAPGVGLVRRSKYFMGEEVFRQELVEYKVQPAKTETRAAEEKEVKHAVEGKKRGSEFKSRDSKEERATRLDDLKDVLENNEKMQKNSIPK